MLSHKHRHFHSAKYEDDDHTNDAATEQKHHGSPTTKYAAITIAVMAVGLFRWRDRLTPTVVTFLMLATLSAGFAAWFIEYCRGVNLDWLVSSLLYAMCLGVCVLAMNVVISIF